MKQNSNQIRTTVNKRRVHGGPLAYLIAPAWREIFSQVESMTMMDDIFLGANHNTGSMQGTKTLLREHDRNPQEIYRTNTPRKVSVWFFAEKNREHRMVRITDECYVPIAYEKVLHGQVLDVEVLSSVIITVEASISASHRHSDSVIYTLSKDLFDDN
jgi:hypothetical protein